VKTAPPNEIFHTTALYNKCPDPRKINLGLGAYRTNEGKPYVLQVVRKVEAKITQDPSLNHEYQPIAGHAGLCDVARELVFGEHKAVKENRVSTVQSISGTGSLALASDFIGKYMKNSVVYIPTPTWPNHPQIFGRHSTVKYYRYWDAKSRGLDLNGLLEDLGNAPERSVVVLHACAHNPTGVDPTRDQWKAIAQLMQKKNLFPLFDSAYQGFATGSLDDDAWAVRYFAEIGFELMVAQSFAKNFGLYDTRTGALHSVSLSAPSAAAVKSQLEILIRAAYSNPPSHGARIVHAILSDPALNREWREELKEMSARIKQTRTMLFDQLKQLGTPGDWQHILNQIGMFSYTGLSKQQCKVLLEKHHVYLLSSGRISMPGINTNNVAYLAKCIDDVVRNVQG